MQHSPLKWGFEEIGIARHWCPVWQPPLVTWIYLPCKEMGLVCLMPESQTRDPLWGLLSKYSCAGPVVNAVVFPVTWGTRNPAGICSKLRRWWFLAGPFTQHHSSIALFSLLPSLDLSEIWRHSCMCMNIGGMCTFPLLWLALGLNFSF